MDHLAKHGIKPHGYNVVMQGDVTRIMGMSDFERRKIIDEIAGVAEFNTKKAQSLSELDVVRERIEREELLLRTRQAGERAEAGTDTRTGIPETADRPYVLPELQGCRPAP